MGSASNTMTDIPNWHQADITKKDPNGFRVATKMNKVIIRIQIVVDLQVCLAVTNPQN